MFSDKELQKLLWPLVIEQILLMLLSLGIIGVGVTMGLDWLARSAAYLVRYKSNLWQSCKAI